MTLRVRSIYLKPPKKLQLSRHRRKLSQAKIPKFPVQGNFPGGKEGKRRKEKEERKKERERCM